MEGNVGIGYATNTTSKVTWHPMWHQEKSESANRSGKHELSEERKLSPDYCKGLLPGEIMSCLNIERVKGDFTLNSEQLTGKW